MQFSDIQQLVAKELTELRALMREQLSTETDLINQVSDHLLTKSGKYLRPTLVLLSAKYFDCRGSIPIALAAVIEFFHASSLLHDDVIDRATLRRGQKTANYLWGEKASILAGDFIFAKAFELILSTPNLEIYQLLATTAQEMSKGEIQQLSQQHRTDLSMAHYLDIIRYKTASLFAASTQIGPLLAKSDPFTIACMRQYGLHLGLAFQMIDDLLDYDGDEAQTGKHLGNDLLEGKVTLPLIYALQQSSAKQRAFIAKALNEKATHHLSAILELIQHTKAVEHTRQQAELAVDQAVTTLAHLPPSDYRDALEHLALLVLNRTA